MSSIQYPVKIDTLLTVPKVTDLVSPVVAADHNVLVDVALALENELGINPSGTFGTVKDRLDAIEAGSFQTINDPFPGAVLSVTDDGELEWVTPADGITSANSPLIIAGHTISIPKADATHDGYLSKEDYVIFSAGGTGITAAEHEALRQLVHLADNGPWEGFASGAYRQTLPSGSLFPTQIIWWESSGLTKKIVDKTITYGSTVATVASIRWRAYDTDGSTVLKTITDSINYNGIVETDRTRAVV